MIQVVDSDYQSMHIVLYNIFEGCHKPASRFERLKCWLKEVNKKKEIDVICLNELNHWDQDDIMKNTATELQFPYYVLSGKKKSPFLIGILSKHPIEVIHLDQSNFHHALLHVQIQGIHIFLTHSNPVSAIRRQAEVSIIQQYAHHITMERKEPVLVLGDLNTLSALDAWYYDQESLENTLIKSSKLKKKFLNESNEIEYGIMNILLYAVQNNLKQQQGKHEQILFDLMYDDEQKNYRGSASKSMFQYSVPTLFNSDPMHAAKLRLDYILGNKRILEMFYISSVQVMRNETTENISDHYPILIHLEKKGC